MNSARQAADAVVKVEKRLEERLTLLWHEIQPWQQDNHYIHSGYRPASYSYRKSVKSLGYLHNETVNVYTHLLGSVVAVVTSLVFYRAIRLRYNTATHEDIVMFGCFFAGAAACLGLSATFHLTSNHSPQVQKFGNKLDYMGIVFLIWGSFVPSVYYGLLEHPSYVRFYWVMITTNGIACATASALDKFRSPAFRPIRAAMFVALGLSAIFPVVSGLKLYGLRALKERIALDWLVAHGLMYIIGAAIYAIFHVLVLCAAATHFVGLIKAFDFQHSQPYVQEDRLHLLDIPWL
ncbi:putative hemolysin-iii channel protein [Neofusicoccum parvum UCRNP2]|uniref:Putative hemolysin-iii channel protein n=1 Tax=Botryosphaeria parva (strain UCR-NP2) TaxID=1287680 RepID=R1GV38_BOTPV|nr:putative hemolysin-iii channel protein [Neofusicoccum parvum UCRNP2]